MRTLRRLNSIISRKYSTCSTDVSQEIVLILVVIKWPRQVLSAIQPTGKIHLGNYLGAINKWVELQNSEKNTVIFEIADLHSITVPQSALDIKRNILFTCATLLACGIDLKKSILFQQSVVPQHTQLCWILATITQMRKLENMAQFKEKCKMLKGTYTGLFLYPILQAADIMLYRGSHVPVGMDQSQHIDLVNYVVHKFNSRFGETFPNVNVLIDPSVGRIKSLVDPSKKMSKSDLNSRATINLTDTPEEILLKCKRALTDFKSELTFEADARPGVSNLLLIHSGLSGKSTEEILEENIGLNTGQYKLILAEYIIEYLKPIRKKINEYFNSPEYLVKELDIGSTKAIEIAEKTMQDVNSKLGFQLIHSCIKNNQAQLAQTKI